MLFFFSEGRFSKCLDIFQEEGGCPVPIFSRNLFGLGLEIFQEEGGYLFQTFEELFFFCLDTLEERGGAT